MATTVLTGRDVTLEIDGKEYAAQTLSAELTIEADRQEYQTLAGKVQKVIDEDGTLEVELLTDWSASESLCVALWDAAHQAPDTALPFTMDVDGIEFGGKVFPVKPAAGGSGNEATEASLSLPVDGEVTRTGEGGGSE